MVIWNVGHNLNDLQTYQQVLSRLDRYAILMDAKFQIPGTRIRFGLDPLIGLFPGIGDVVGLMMSLYVVVETVRLGAPRRLVLGMLRNIAVEALMGVVPVLGDLFDVGFKANLRNVRLLRNYVGERMRPAPLPQRRLMQWLLLVCFFVLMVGLMLFALMLLISYKPA